MGTEISKEYLGGYRKDSMKHDLVAMEIACLAAKESKDPSTQVGACILSSDERVISTGFNHNPEGWDENDFPWRNDVNIVGEENTKYPYIIHAETDAISKCNNREELKKGTIYVTLFPCINCAKQIVAHGIKKVVFVEYRDSLEAQCTMRLFKKCGVELVCIKKMINTNSELEKNNTKKLKLKLNLKRG